MSLLLNTFLLFSVISLSESCCQAGYSYHSRSGDCIPCDSNKWSFAICSEENTYCRICNNGVVSNYRRTCTCGAAYYQDSQYECQQCGDGKYKISPGNNIDSCVHCSAQCANTHKQSTPCTIYADRVCVLCGLGTYKRDFMTCSSCDSDCSASQKETQQCTASSNRQCELCSGDTFKDSDVSCAACLVCTAGQEPSVACSSTSNRQCQSCVVGKSKTNSGDGACSNCIVGKHAATTGLAACNQCATGKYAAATGLANCILCETGKSQAFVEMQQCDFCATGKHAATTGLEACNECATGKHAATTGLAACNECVTGKHAATTGLANCNQCATGKYAATTGLVNCIPCETGKSQASVGMSECQNCAAGKYAATTGLAACTQCEPGKFQASSGMLACDLCAIGKYQHLYEQHSCKVCAAGKFRESRGANSILQCIDCGLDEFSDEGASSCGTCLDQQKSGPGSKTCSLCNAGFFWNSDSFSCAPCHSQTYKVEQGPSVCKSCVGASVFKDSVTVCTPLTIPCVTEQYYKGIVCTKCPRNHTTPPNPQNVILYSDSCVCVAGYEKTHENVCMPCSPGHYAPNINTRCQKSPAGTYVSIMGSVFAQKCPDNWISTSAAASYCVPCPWGTLANVKNTVCVPRSSGAAPVATIQEYQLSFFCMESSTAYRGFLGSATGITKLNTNAWDGDAKAVQLYPEFLNETEHFRYANSCEIGFLHSQPMKCDSDSYAMRMHTYIWECVPCPFGMYKKTQGTSRAECMECSGMHCPHIEQICGAEGKVYVLNTERNSPDLFKTSVGYS